MPFPPPIIKYISLYATYLHPIYSGRRLPVGPSPWSHPRHPCLPPTPGRLPRWEAEPSVVHLGLQVLPTRGKSTAFIRPSTRKKIHTTPITHARREGPGPPSSPDTRDLRREAEEKRDTPGRPASGTPPGRSVVARHAWWPTWPEGWGARAPGPPLTSKHPAPRTLV